MQDKERVWVAEPRAGFVLGKIVDFAVEGPVVQPFDRNLKPITTGYDRMYPAEEDEKKEVDDNCSLMYLNEATLLNNVNLRYAKDKIYTYFYIPFQIFSGSQSHNALHLDSEL